MAALLRQLIPPLSWRSAALWLIVGVNIVLIALYFWSREGSTTEVRIEAIGSTYRAFVDRRLIVTADFAGRDEGGIGLALPENGTRVPSLPEPSGIDWVRVTDAGTSQVLFEDSFDGPPSDVWQDEGGSWRAHDGVFSVSSDRLVVTAFRPWRDYVLEAALKNVPSAKLYVRMKDADNAVVFSIRPYRNYDSFLSLIEGSVEVERQRGQSLLLDRGQTIRSIVAILLRPYPTAVLMVAGAIVLAFVVRLPWAERRLRAGGQLVLQGANTIVLALAVTAFILLWYLVFIVGDAMPHVPDSVAYVFQAKIFASFRLTADPPPVFQSFNFFNPPFMAAVEGRWFTQYPFGHPLFLAVGQLVGAIWLVPPLLGAGSVALIYWVGKRVYGVSVGLVAAALLLFSPFFQMSASDFMSHNTAAFLILASLFFLTRPLKRRTLSMFLSGILLGLLFNIRPLTGTALVLVLVLFLGYELLRAGDERGRLFREDLALAAGGTLLLLAYFGYNQATTGDFLRGTYTVSGTYSSNTFGFGGSHSVARGLQNEQVLLSLMVLVADGWPLAIGLIFAMLPFLMGTRHRWDYFLGASALALAATPVFYVNPAVMHGPRFWYETMPFLMLLTARGILSLGEAGVSVGDWFAGQIGWRPSVPSQGVTGFAVFGLVAALVAFSAWGWMLGRREPWPRIIAVPSAIADLKGFNFTDPRLLDRVEEMEIENALVLVEKCRQWWCYGSVFWTNSPDLDGDIVWAVRQGNADDIALLRHFEGRDLYVANYDAGSIQRVTKAELLAAVEVSGSEQGQRPPGPEDGLLAEERDQLRRDDLETLRQALERYAAANGRYPSTANKVQTLCLYQTLDAGCALTTVLPGLPSRDPLGAPVANGYWYLSDGTSFALMARQEATGVDKAQCPRELAQLANIELLYCVRGGSASATPPPAALPSPPS